MSRYLPTYLPNLDFRAKLTLTYVFYLPDTYAFYLPDNTQTSVIQRNYLIKMTSIYLGTGPCRKSPPVRRRWPAITADDDDWGLRAPQLLSYMAPITSKLNELQKTKQTNTKNTYTREKGKQTRNKSGMI